MLQEAPDEERSALLELLDAPTRREVGTLLAYAEDDAGGSGSMDLAAAGLEPRGLCRGATEVLPPVLGGRDCGCWAGDITGVPVARIV